MNGTDSVVVLNQEIRRDHVARYDHRLHGVLLVMRGMSCQQVGRLLGDSARSLQYWVKRFETEGLPGLSEKGRPGRPRRLNSTQITELEMALKRRPRDFGLTAEAWDAKSVASYLNHFCGIQLGARQCQRLLNQCACQMRKNSAKALRPSAMI